MFEPEDAKSMREKHDDVEAITQMTALFDAIADLMAEERVEAHCDIMARAVRTSIKYIYS